MLCFMTGVDVQCQSGTAERSGHGEGQFTQLDE